MRRLLLVLLPLLFVSSAAASHAPTNLSILRYSAKTVTISWVAAPGVTGYGLFVDGTRVATAGASATQAKFGTPQFRRYVLGVSALKTGGAMSTITVDPRWVTVSVDIPEEPPPPPGDTDTVPTSIPANCSTDASSALQTWLNNRANGSTLTFASGSCYLLNAPLSLSGRSGLTINGAGSTLRTTPGDGHRPLWRLTNGSNLTIRGFRLEGGYATPGTHNTSLQWSHGVEVLGTQTVLIEDVTALNVAGDCVYLGLGNQRTTGATVRRLTCTGTGRNGVSFVASNNSRVEQSSTSTIGYVAFDVEPNSGAGFGVDGAVMTDNTIGTYVINALTLLGDNQIANITFSSNNIVSPLGARIQITGLPRRTNVTISGNTATTSLNYPQAIRMENVDGAVVTNNNLPTTGVMLRCVSVTGLTFSGNTPSTSDGCPITAPAGSISPGASWQTAYDNASAGSVLTVLAGNHGQQTLSGAKAVTFLGQDGARLTGLTMNASAVTVDNVDIDGDGVNRTILINGGNNNTYRNLEVRDNTDIQMVGNNGDNGTYTNVVFHDAVMTTAGENAGVHMECIWSNGPGLTIRNSRFYNCAVMDLFLTRGDWWGQPNVCCITLEDNIFEPSKRTNNSGVHFYSVGIHDNADNLDRYTVKRNRFDLPVNNTNPALSNSVFCENTGSAPAGWTGIC